MGYSAVECHCRGCELGVMDQVRSDSAVMCDIEEAFWSSVLLRDWGSAVQWVRGWLAIMVKPL